MTLNKSQRDALTALSEHLEEECDPDFLLENAQELLMAFDEELKGKHDYELGPDSHDVFYHSSKCERCLKEKDNE